MRSFGIFRRVEWQFLVTVARQPNGSHFQRSNSPRRVNVCHSALCTTQKGRRRHWHSGGSPRYMRGYLLSYCMGP